MQIVTTRPGRRVAPMPSGTKPDSSRDDSIMTPGDATLGAQEVKEDLPKPADRRIMICARLRASAASQSYGADATILAAAARAVTTACWIAAGRELLGAGSVHPATRGTLRRTALEERRHALRQRDFHLHPVTGTGDDWAQLNASGLRRGIPSLSRTRRSMRSADFSLGACFSPPRSSPAVSMLPATQPRPV